MTVVNPEPKWTVAKVTRLIVDSGILKRPLSQDAVAALMAKGSIRSYPKGTMILQRGEQKPRFFVVLKGTVRLAAHTVQGREFVSIFLPPGNFWGVYPCLSDVAESHDSLAQTDVELLAVPAQHLRDLMWENREVQETLVEFLCTRLSLALAVAEQYVTWTPRARLAWRVLSMCQTQGIKPASGPDMEITMSQEALASMINLSRQRTNILLKELEREGVLAIGYGRIRVKDSEALRAILDNPSA